MAEITLTPITELTADAVKFIHIHADKDELKRSCNLTGNVRAIPMDEEEATLPTIYYEYVSAKDIAIQVPDEADPSKEIFEDLQIFDDDKQFIGGWVMHALCTDIARFYLMSIASEGGSESSDSSDSSDSE